ncbi:MAG: T9SS type A sorting domain-containing protein [bacterium]|nr:T9SS type A sorting domain-containing protein [bacterium]
MMNSKTLNFLLSALGIGLFLLLAAAPVQAQFVIRGVGLSGQPTAIDSVVEQGDEVFVIAQIEVPQDWNIDALQVEGSPRWQVRALFYSLPTPFGNPVSADWLAVDSLGFIINDGSEPQAVSFRMILPEVLNQNIRSMQLLMGIVGTDNEAQEQFSDAVASYIPFDDYIGINYSIDNGHRAFLAVAPVNPTRPTIHEPVSNDTISSNFLMRFDLPQDARRRTLQLEVRETPDVGGLLVHRLYLADTLAGVDKEVHVNALNLAATPGLDSLAGINFLNHRSRVELRLYYRLVDGQSSPSDTARVESLFGDLQSELPILTEPDIDSESPSPSVRVIYRLPEVADSVWLTFETDSQTVQEDPLSPHVLTLVPSLYAAQEHYFVLDGTNIGAGTQWVLANPNGATDALVSQALYNVTLTYRDLVGNPSVSVTNFGFIWPEDLTTVPPSILAPTTGSVENTSFWIQFNLPEPPLPGSVYLVLAPLPLDPDYQHEVQLGELSSRGITGLTLNAQALSQSGTPVTGVEGPDQMQSGATYTIRVFYRDEHGNPEAGSLSRVARYDGETEVPLLLEPSPGDTLPLTDAVIIYTQTERAAAGTLQLILEQTGGPEPDLLSPHTLYLSNIEIGATKTVTIHPSFISAGEGIDSVHNAGSLVPRGRYRLTLRYRDALNNTEAAATANDLLFPSGSVVIVRGAADNTTVLPGARDIQLMHLAFTAAGESALRGLRFGVEGGLLPSDLLTNGIVVWSSSDSVLQTGLDTPLDSLDNWIAGDLLFDSLVYSIGSLERYVIVSGSYTNAADPSHQAGLVFTDGLFADCGGDPVYCTGCPIGGADFGLPVEVTSMYVEQDTTFTSLVVSWIVASEFNTLGFRLWRYDPDLNSQRVVASYSDNPDLYGRGNAAVSKRYSVVDHSLRSGTTYTYRIDVVGMDGLTVYPVELEASGTTATAPAEFALTKVYPNPFNQEVYIEFVAPITEEASLTIYNVLGQPVRELLHAQLAPSNYRVRWDAKDSFGQTLPSGIYIVRLRAAGRFDSAQKILLLR